MRNVSGASDESEFPINSAFLNVSGEEERGERGNHAEGTGKRKNCVFRANSANAAFLNVSRGSPRGGKEEVPGFGSVFAAEPVRKGQAEAGECHGGKRTCSWGGYSAFFIDGVNDLLH